VHPQRSVITRALGTEADVDVDVFSVEAEDGDLYLLCSDGLSTMVPTDTIAEILRSNRRSLESATHALIKAANDRGGDDNITAILFAVADGEAGEAVWRNPTKSHGYLNDPARTEEMFWGDGYYRSGDIGVVDADGYLRIVGRSKDVIIRGGQNISPRELEELVAQNPDVLEVAVIGVPDAVYGERVAACIVPHPGRRVDVADLAQFLAVRQVARHKQPEVVELFAELPRNAGGKLAKLDLKAEVGRRVAARAQPSGGGHGI